MPEPNRRMEFYTVRCRPFDGGGDGASLLDYARRKYFAEGRAVRGNVRAVESGLEVCVRYRFAPGCFRWKKKCGRQVLQEAFAIPGGKFRLMSHSPAGDLLSAASYDAGLHWIQTAYYSGGPARPAALLRPEGENLSLLECDPASGEYARTLLLPCPMEPGSAAQSYVDGRAGEPRVCARTDAGMFCFCPAEERKLRLALLRRLKDGKDSLIPEWPDGPEEKLDFRVIPNDGAAPVAPVHKKKEAPVSGKVKPAVPAAVPASVPVSAKREYFADHELFSAPQDGSRKYAVARKGLSGGVQVAGADSSTRPAPVQSAPERSAGAAKPAVPAAVPAAVPVPVAGMIPAQRIVVSSMESYLYFGRLLDGLREGQGRTQMAGGHTAYEGGYRKDQRSGFGVYYYKSGRLCYAGGWRRNLRHGMGVAFGSEDGSIFVGHWKDGVATGYGSAFDMEGNLLYTGGWKDGMRDGGGTEYRGGRAVRSGVWRQDQFCPGEQEGGA